MASPMNGKHQWKDGKYIAIFYVPNEKVNRQRQIENAQRKAEESLQTTMFHDHRIGDICESTCREFEPQDLLVL